MRTAGTGKADIAKSNHRYFGKLFTQELMLGSELVDLIFLGTEQRKRQRYREILAYTAQGYD